MAKVIAFQPDNRVLVSMSVGELLNLSGAENSGEFIKVGTIHGQVVQFHEDLMALEIPISSIFKEAQGTISAYSELKTKLESVRNQIAFLTGKMKVEE